MIKLDYTTRATPKLRIWARRYLVGILCLGTLHFVGSVHFPNEYFFVDPAASTLWSKDAYPMTSTVHDWNNGLFKAYEFPMILVPMDSSGRMMLRSQPYYIELAIYNAIFWSACVIGLWHLMWIAWRRRRVSRP